MNPFVIILWTMVFMPTVWASAVVLHLKDGHSVEGAIVEQNNNDVKINVDGIVMTYFTNEIVNVEKKSPTEVQAVQPDSTEDVIRITQSDFSVSPQTPATSPYQTPAVPAADSRQAPKILERSLGNDPQQKYYVYLPVNYDSNKKTYPLLIAVHGDPGSAQGMIESWYDFTNRDQYILLCPQFQNGYQRLQHQEDQALISIMNEVSDEFSYDSGKVYLMGFSGGAQFAHRFVFRHPDCIKAVAIISAGSYSAPPSDLSGVKFFVGVGEYDTKRLDITKQFYQGLLDQGYDAQLKIYPRRGHSCEKDVISSVAEYFKSLQN